MSPRQPGHEPGDVTAKSIANDLGVSSGGRFHSYDNLLDWATQQYWQNRTAAVAKRGAA